MDVLLQEINESTNKYINNVIEKYIGNLCVPDVDENLLFDSKYTKEIRERWLNDMFVVFERTFPNIKFRVKQCFSEKTPGCRDNFPRNVSGFVFTNYNFYIKVGVGEYNNSYGFDIYFYGKTMTYCFPSKSYYYSWKSDPNQVSDFKEFLEKESINRCILPIVIVDYLSTLTDSKEIYNYFLKVDKFILSQQGEKIKKLENDKIESTETIIKLDNIIANLREQLDTEKNNIINLRNENKKTTEFSLSQAEKKIRKLKDECQFEIGKLHDNYKCQIEKLHDDYKYQITELKEKIDRLKNELVDSSLNNKKLSNKLNDMCDLYEKLEQKFMNL